MTGSQRLMRCLIAAGIFLLGFLLVGCPLSLGSRSAQAPPPGTEASSTKPPHHIGDTTQAIVVYTIEEARSLVPFVVRVPSDASIAYFVWADQHKDAGYNVLGLTYEPTDAPNSKEAHRHPIFLTESETNITSGDPTDPIEVDGVMGQMVRGGDIGQPTLLAIHWHKDGISYVAQAIATDWFTKDDLVRLINSFQ